MSNYLHKSFNTATDVAHIFSLEGVYTQLTQSPTNVNLVQAHLQALTQASKSNAEAINRAMQISASMFC
ncbi:MAG: hypothetical protein IGS49_05975 [Chlorogloeopsis fritschii C42_A2020_084]|uniref:hypothetical protein n=1 Tax=Chlorogloeopsis fritschii TaxID=1124 RepID=UPI001A0D1722|nr:hypothetical protein [Chlorogloeopsis fritschii]MBF2005011.1 hypothetical protein [Chlorogloeopsis fritschii C42_A2020_084]